MSVPPKLRSATRRPHILIVTADEDLRAFLAEGLLIGGFWTSVVASGLQAVEVFRLRSFDLVLIDAAVPGFGGLGITRRLRAARSEDRTTPLTDVPIILIADSPEQLSTETAVAAGADGVRYPPIEIEDLAVDLATVVAEWQAAHPGRLMADEVAAIKPGERVDGQGLGA